MNYEIDHDKWAEEKPHGYSGLFRLRNESEFMERAVLSHLPYLDEAVLITQPSEDNTEDIAQRLEREYPDKVRVCHYPFDTAWAGTERFYAMDPDEVGHAVHMSNWGLSQCKYSWIVKPEGDVIALPRFQNIIDWIELNPDEYSYLGWVILNIAGIGCNQISVDNPRNGGWDTAAFPNHPDYHFIRFKKWDQIQTTGKRKCFGICGLHMKRCKQEFADGFEDEVYAPLERDTVEEVMARFNDEYKYPGDNWLRELDDVWESINE